MVLGIVGNLKMESLKVMEFGDRKKMITMKVNLKIIKNMERACINGIMGLCLRVILRKSKKMCVLI
jgi:hypothetical protein